MPQSPMPPFKPLTRNQIFEGHGRTRETPEKESPDGQIESSDESN